MQLNAYELTQRSRISFAYGVIARWDDVLVTLDVDSNRTTIGQIKSTIIDEYKAQSIAEGHRVLRDYCLPSAVVFYHNGRELTSEQTLSECGIPQFSVIETAHAAYETTRKRYGHGFEDDGWAQELTLSLEKQRKREERKRQRELQALEAQEEEEDEAANLLQQERDAEMEVDEPEDGQHSASMGGNGEYAEAQEEREEQAWEETDQRGSLRIPVDRDESDLVDFEMFDAYATEDMNKENWDPQILRVPVGNAIEFRRRPLRR